LEAKTTMRKHEEMLTAALAEVLGVDADTLSPTRSFAEQGVDSLLGLRFARRVQDLAGAEFDAEWLFDHPSLRELAAFLAAQDAQAAAAAG
jgi:acyl carrier protein